MRIAICDDEKDFIHNFQLLLKQYSKKQKNINQFKKENKAGVFKDKEVTFPDEPLTLLR